MGLRRSYREWSNQMARRKAYRDWQKHRLGTISYHGIQVPLSGSHMIKPIVNQLYSNSYELPEINALMAVLKPNDRVLELGTGLGIITALAARAVSGGRVVTFEANPTLIAPATALFLKNDIRNVEARHGVIVAGSGGGALPFYLNPSFAEGSLSNKSTNIIDVPTWSAEQILSDLRPNVLICDIEGAEGDLLPTLDLSGLRGAIVEFHPHILSRTAVAGIYNHLAKYRLYPLIEHSTGTVVAFERVDELARS